MSSYARHALFRATTVIATLAQSIVITRALDLSQIGTYYVIAAVAYLGSAVVFVGADLHLQKRVSDVVIQGGQVRLSAAAAYGAQTGLAGLLVVGAAAALFFRAQDADVVPSTLVCCLLASAAYAATLFRNVLLVSGHAVRSSALQTADALGRLAFVACAGNVASLRDPLALSAVSALGSLCVLLACVAFLRPKRRPDARALPHESASITARRILPLGLSGILNWAQTQGYRPLLSLLHVPLDVVGTAALLIGLGSTAASSFFAVLAQVFVPRQYQSRGGQTAKYVAALVAVAVALGVLSIPAGWLFLHCTNKQSIMAFAPLIVVGVALEAGSAAIGIAINHANARAASLWHLPLAGSVACAATLVLLLAAPQALGIWSIGAALLAGQAIAATMVWLPALHRTRSENP